MLQPCQSPAANADMTATTTHPSAASGSTATVSQTVGLAVVPDANKIMLTPRPTWLAANTSGHSLRWNCVTLTCTTSSAAEVAVLWVMERVTE